MRLAALLVGLSQLATGPQAVDSWVLAARIVERAAAARRTSERECLATLHDTASVTLLMVSFAAHSEPPARLPERVARDSETLATVPSAQTSPVARAVSLRRLKVALAALNVKPAAGARSSRPQRTKTGHFCPLNPTLSGYVML